MEDYTLHVSDTQVTTGPTPTVPAPVAQTGSSVAADGFTAQWAAVTGATGYRLDVSADGFQTFVVQDQAVSAINHRVTSLTANTAYSYRVRATTAAGTSADSNVINVQTLAGSTQPTDVPTATDATGVEDFEFTANWNAVNGATQYLLDVSTDNFQTFVLQGEEVAGTSFLVEDLDDDMAYSYRIRAVLTAGPSTYSNVVSLRTTAEL